MTVSTYFEQQFGHAPAMSVFVPGRVNLIGEHIDYNGGRVLPFALSSGVDVAVAPREDAEIVVTSDRYEGVAQASLSGDMLDGWGRYAFYAARLAHKEGWIGGGLNISVISNLSDGAGLSSSAALCVAILKAISRMTGNGIDDVTIAKLARRVENEDIGMPCGIMDQMAVAVGQPGEAIFLDTSTLEYDVIELPKAYTFEVLHSGVRRELADGRYRARKEECDAAKKFFETEDLCHLSLAEIDQASALDKAVRRRVRHCVTEHERTVAAAAALAAGHLGEFGRLMDESHTSMRDDFEMSVAGVDELVRVAKHHGAIGARLTGGGFGGCIVACVEAESASAWSKAVLTDVPQAFRVS